MVSRRHVTLSLTSLLTVGCTGRPTAPSGDADRSMSSSTTPSTSSPSAILDCEGRQTVMTPDAPDSSAVSPPSYPPFPSSLDADTAASYVSSFETAYVLNGLLRSNPDASSVDIGVADSPPVEETPRGFVVDLSYTYAVEAGTPADYPPQHVAYLVREGVVARVSLEPNESPVPFPVSGADFFRCST